MGRRGPAPTPTPILIARGSKRATKRRLEMEAKGPEGTPACPEWLDPEARAHWAGLIPKLESMGVLTLADEGAVARYCHLWARWRKAEDFIAKHGEVYPLKDETGKVSTWPNSRRSVSRQSSRIN